jgi:phage shock protein E
MNWIVVLVMVGLLVVFLVVRRTGQIAETAAATHLKTGALVIDVRSAAEFRGGHLQRAINMPLPDIEMLVARRVQDKNQVLLLHCQSGMRSGLARRKLAALGYTRAFNMGSYDRAARIVGAA